MRPTLIVSLFTFLGMLIGFATQVVLAGVFGAGEAMDAYLAANTLPQYVTSIVFGALSVVFIPVFVERIGSGHKREAWQIAVAILNLSLISLAAVTVLGILFAEDLLRWTVPGLAPSTLQLATRIARLAWPTILANGVISVLTSIYQAQGQFGWAAAVPTLGMLMTFVFVALLRNHLSILGLALIGLMSLLLQVILLLRVFFLNRVYKPALGLQLPGVSQVWYLLWPLLISGLFIRASTVVDRYVASSLSAGSISHLGYAFKMVGWIATFLSTGIMTAILPDMAFSAATSDFSELRRILSLGLRLTWVMAAPAISLCVALALPVVTLLFQRGAFSGQDAQAVAGLFQWYAPVLGAMALGSVTGRVFYALKETRVVAVMGIVEMLAYTLYTPWLAKSLGATGVALAYFIYFNGSLFWHVPVIWYKLGRQGGRGIVNSFGRNGLAAFVSGLVAWGCALLMPNVWAQLGLGGLLGMATYLALLFGMKSAEGRMIWNTVFNRT